MTVARANFPVSGPRENPTADDYDLEAMLLREDALTVYRESHEARPAQYALAKRFEKVARRKRWAESACQRAGEAIGMPRARTKDRQRYPSGKLKPDTSLSPTLIRRMIDQARAGASNQLLGSELGRIRLHGVITDREMAAGVRYGEVVGRYHRLKGIPAPSPKSPSYERGFGLSLTGDPDVEVIEAAERHYNAACAVLARFGRRLISAVDCVVIFDTAISTTSQGALKFGLGILVDHFGLTGRKT